MARYFTYDRTRRKHYDLRRYGKRDRSRSQRTILVATYFLRPCTRLMYDAIELNERRLGPGPLSDRNERLSKMYLLEMNRPTGSRWLPICE